MADKKEKGKLHVNIDEIENGFEVSCYRDKKETLSKRAGWVPCAYVPPKKYSFPTMEKVLEHIKKEAA